MFLFFILSKKLNYEILKSIKAKLLSILKAPAFFYKKTLKTSPKLTKKCFAELGAKAVFKLVATNSLDNQPQTI